MTKCQASLDASEAIKLFIHIADHTRVWNAHQITVACLVAQSVMHDEYKNRTDLALKTLDDADLEFPENVSLLRQRAKVLFNDNRHKESLAAANLAVSLDKKCDVEHVFCCRSAGISAAKCDMWSESERFFASAVKTAENCKLQKDYVAGLMVDQAYAQWKQGKYDTSILLFANILDRLEEIPLELSLERLLITRWLHAVRNQSFAFSAPSVVRPEIEKVCADEFCKGMTKIATILNISRIHLRIPVSEAAIEVLVKISKEN